MTYTEVTGDLFGMDLPAIGHGVNCAGVMGAGIAVEFKRRWPVMYLEYKALCTDERLVPGDIFTWYAGHGVRVYNMATQQRPDGGARLHIIGKCVRAVLEHARQRDLPKVGIPRIGAGLGGLDWDDVRVVLRAVSRDASTELVVVSLPEVP